MENRNQFFHDKILPSCSLITLACLVIYIVISFPYRSTVSTTKASSTRVNVKPIASHRKVVMNIEINEFHEILVDGQLVDELQLLNKMKEFIMNPKQSRLLPATPKNAIISIQRNDRFLSKLSIVKQILDQGYQELREEFTQTYLGVTYANLTPVGKEAVHKEIPILIYEPWQNNVSK